VVLFGVQKPLADGNCRLLVDLLDTHKFAPVTLHVVINGRKFEQRLPAGAGNDSIAGQLAKGKPFQLTVEFPAALLKAGDNRLEIRNVVGSWFLYDRVALEVPAGLQGRPVENVPAPPSVTVSKDVRITVDLARVVNTMRGGIGASWHAVVQPIPVSETPHPVFPNKSHGGSDWGAYPPAEDDAAWAQTNRHARWLGLDWNRVEFEQRIYEPERNQFSWDNPEMRILYRILDWCERNKADVFLQQMWGNVCWNTFPEWRDDPVAQMHSGPQSLEDFGEGLAALVEHLVKTKRYTCIRWLSITNEPNGNWSWWQEPPNRLMPLKPGLAAVRQTLDKRGLTLPLSGPDLTGGVPELDPQRFDFHGQALRRAGVPGRGRGDAEMAARVCRGLAQSARPPDAGRGGGSPSHLPAKLAPGNPFDNNRPFRSISVSGSYFGPRCYHSAPTSDGTSPGSTGWYFDFATGLRLTGTVTPCNGTPLETKTARQPFRGGGVRERP